MSTAARSHGNSVDDEEIRRLAERLSAMSLNLPVTVTQQAQSDVVDGPDVTLSSIAEEAPLKSSIVVPPRDKAGLIEARGSGDADDLLNGLSPSELQKIYDNSVKRAEKAALPPGGLFKGFKDTRSVLSFLHECERTPSWDIGYGPSAAFFQGIYLERCLSDVIRQTVVDGVDRRLLQQGYSSYRKLFGEPDVFDLSCYKPPRAHHCSKCKRCVDRMDHHCDVTGNCIGARNQGSFILVFIFGSAACVYAQYMIWSTVLLKEGFPNLFLGVKLNTWQYVTYGHFALPLGLYVHLSTIIPSCAGGATLMLLATFGALIALAFMFWGQCGQIMRNVTFLEKRPYKAE
ncbi:zinc finger protein DHHC domain containing protein, putative [Perkinsus marinus ATCC 50983]|uniref:Palmitoyltransferase n=1 Tax=Perkinsus marinus (strain ATCC 50983 / TXsc) TaxID=423536 RepID=C5LVZ0_PERM5|nr:zinc finger protein DHHC domain containing protein, putative [Perkinsus marinus ATCC 50983]EEQ99060.1 zinc finger protein DHHC domain containing protein, putative [Perkinsus marinus ATCC 50983]|eukprot:XP_002766343.1 zinc finger protein DHHC domain containing protein, putative [Perkinsus marinus ATCC 50983]